MLLYTELPESEYCCRDIEISIGDRYTVNPCSTRVSAVPYNTTWPGTQRFDDQTEIAYFFSFTTDEATEIKVKMNRDFEKAVVRPLSRNITPEISGRVVSFAVPGEGHYVLECDDYHNALHIFVNAPFKQPDNETLVFKNGVHYIGIMRLEDNQEVFIEDGAVSYGGFTAVNKENITICGGGIIDGSYESRHTDTRTNPNMHFSRTCPDMDITKDMSVLEKALYGDKMLGGALRFYNCKNIKVCGPVIRDTCTYGLIAAGCTNVCIENLKLIGMWKYNSDGIDIFNSKDVEIKNCFIRTFDDSIVLKGIKGWDSYNVEDISVYNCVVWCDWGRNLEIGAETTADMYNNIIFSDCDLIHGTHAMMDIQHFGRAKIKNVAFKNIRCEYNKNQLPLKHQSDLNMKYSDVDKRNTQQPLLMFAGNAFGNGVDMFSGDTEKGSVSGVIFDGIYIITDGEVCMPKSKFVGADETHRIDGVVIKNVYFNGKKLQSKEDANISFNEFSEVVFM